MMTDYDCFPLWQRDENGTTNVDPASLPISAELASALLAWADEYDETLDRDDPIRSGFPDEAAAEAFDRQGRELARRLASELGRTVHYFDSATATDVPVTP
ncbi:hypothetical protein ACFQS1_26290 [Paractinoplanes rhizophilus]|uniref:Uncharacterized protein n=1 Tax=Paractinoplanes rhizophilus TaxID=1416877 RepID=A0ABW2I0E0_9ACTN